VSSSKGFALRVRSLSKLLILLFIPFLLASVPASADVTLEEAAKLLPDRVGDFSARGSARISRVGILEQYRPEDFGAYSHAARAYISPGGEALGVDLVRTRSDSGAYALLTSGGMYAHSPQTTRLNDVGTAGIATPSGIAFFKGTAFVSIYHLDRTPGNTDAIMGFARLLAQSLGAGEGEIPVLVKHLPDWVTAQERATYAVSFSGLQKATENQPVLEAINFDGGTEAVTATYGSSRLVLVEYTTPQLATDSDARITARIKELSDQGGSAVPSAYRRVGNYSVFVFNAPDQETAKQLIDSVNYEQVVQWLGDNPRALERMQRIYTETTAGIILAVIKASGLAVLLCLGGIFGALIFRHRRAQQAATAAYSDAGNMIRLNIDDLTPRSSPARLLGRGDG
jgi:hypothetical protein